MVWVRALHELAASVRRRGSSDSGSGIDGALQKIQESSETHGNFSRNAILSSLGYSVVLCTTLLVFFCAVRPYHNAVFAPKVKFAMTTPRARPSRSPLAWLPVVLRRMDSQDAERIGMDAATLLRFVNMLRIIFFVLSIVVASILLPLNYLSTKSSGSSQDTLSRKNPLAMLSVQTVTGGWLWAHVILSWATSAFVMGMLYWTYARMLRYRQEYFASPAYQKSLHSRTIMVTGIPRPRRTQPAFEALARGMGDSDHIARVAIGRDVGRLAEYFDEYNERIRRLEKTLDTYFKRRQKRGDTEARPTVQVGGRTVDAFSHYFTELQALETKVEQARADVDSFGTQKYGFVCYDSVTTAHAVAKRQQDQQGSSTVEGVRVRMASVPKDLLWRNLEMPSSLRRRNRHTGNLLFFLLSVLWIVPSALIATFIANISNIGDLSASFSRELKRNPTLWALIQGIASPIILSVFFAILPVAMRRLSAWQGNFTKTARERDVLSKLFFFFVFNNLVLFTLIQTVWNVVTQAIYAQRVGGGSSWWNAIRNFGYLTSIADGIVSTNAFWIMYIAQQYVSCFIQMSQIINVILRLWNQLRRGESPREKIEWSAPPPFLYSVYYNYYLFIALIALVYSVVAPLVLPFCFLYFMITGFTTKYCLYYINITKIETGGSFWKMAFNRMAFSMFFASLIHFLVIFMRSTDARWRSYCVLPLLGAWAVFWVYMRKRFSARFDFAHDQAPGGDVMAKKSQETAIGKGLSIRYGHIALTEPLLVPMVRKEYKSMLDELLAEYNVSFTRVTSRMSAERKHDDADEMLVGIDGRYGEADEGPAGDMGISSAGQAPAPGFEMVDVDDDMDVVAHYENPDFVEKQSIGDNGSVRTDPFSTPRLPAQSRVSRRPVWGDEEEDAAMGPYGEDSADATYMSAYPMSSVRLQESGYAVAPSTDLDPSMGLGFDPRVYSLSRPSTRTRATRQSWDAEDSVTRVNTDYSDTEGLLSHTGVPYMHGNASQYSFEGHSGR